MHAHHSHREIVKNHVVDRVHPTLARFRPLEDTDTKHRLAQYHTHLRHHEVASRGSAESECNERGSQAGTCEHGVTERGVKEGP